MHRAKTIVGEPMTMVSLAPTLEVGLELLKLLTAAVIYTEMEEIRGIG